MVTEEQLRQFLGCGQAAQKAIDEVIAQANKDKDLALEVAAKKAVTTGNRSDLHEYLRLRRIYCG